MRYALILGFVALPAFAQDAGSPDTEAEPPVAGVGRLACSAIVGPENAAYLGQAGDWALGYLAGRLDAGDELDEDATLSPEDSVDVVTSIAMQCREEPDQAVIEAVRGFAEEVFGAEAQAGPVTADAPPPPPDMPEAAAGAEPPRESVAPEPRPDAEAPGGAESDAASPDAAEPDAASPDTASPDATSSDTESETTDDSAGEGADAATDASDADE